MPYCPKCSQELYAGEEVCPECYVDSVQEIPAPIPEDADENDWVDIYTFTSSMYARMAVEMLQREGVPAYSQTLFDGIINSGSSTTVYVLEIDYEHASEVIEPIIDELPDISYGDDDYGND